MNELINFLKTSEAIGSLLVVAISIVFFYIIKETALSYINKKKKSANRNKKKKLTILYLCVSSLKYIVFLVDIVIILGIFKVNVTAFLTGLGIFGIVIGLALQDLLKDFIAGITIILDSQYSVGEYISVDGWKGEVIGVGLKSTKVRDYEGNIKIFANRNVEEIINFSHYNTKCVIEFTFSSDENLVKLEEAMEELIKRCSPKIKDTTDKLKYKGVQEYKDSKLILRLTIDVKPAKQAAIEKVIYREAKLLFDEREIKIK